MQLGLFTFCALLAAPYAAHGETKNATSPRTDKYGPIEVRARVIDKFLSNEPEKTKFRRLKWLGGLSLLSSSPLFGGISGFTLGRQGKKFIAITDQGTWIRGEILYEKSKPTALNSVTVGPLLARNGRPLRTKRDQDAEGISLIQGTPDRGEVLISFERNHRIGRFPVTKNGVGKPRSYLRNPKGLRGVKRNKGLEAVTPIGKGRYKGSILAFAERKLSKKGHLEGWIIRGRKSLPVRLKRLGGFDVTDLATLPSGDILVLERRFRWSEGIQMRLRLIPLSKLKPGRVIRGETLLEADGAFAIDNMEGLAVHRTSEGKTIISLISDDNFSVLQRTLLLQFELLKKEKLVSGH